MIIFKEIDQYDKNTGKKISTLKVADYYICDFTGERIIENSNPNTYRVNYNDNDHCAGDGDGEGWLYDWEKDREDECDLYELFLQSDYVFQTSETGVEVFQKMFNAAEKEMKGKLYSLDHLLRWSRGRMLEKVLKAGTYKINQFIEED